MFYLFVEILFYSNFYNVSNEISYYMNIFKLYMYLLSNKFK